MNLYMESLDSASSFSGSKPQKTNHIITNENFKNKTSILNTIFLYTEEDKDLVKYVRENYKSLGKLSGNWCCIHVFEKPCSSPENLKKYWLSLLKDKLYKELKVLEWITDTKPFDKNESYKVAEKLDISPSHFPCLVVLPPSSELSNKNKLIIPIKEVSTNYFINLLILLF